MRLPKIQRAGTEAAHIIITGDPRNQEPTHVRIIFPGGEIEVTRARDGADADYWVHVNVNHPDNDLHPDDAVAKISDARIDLKHKHASESDAGDLRDPDMYHLAVRVTRTKE